MSTFRISKNHSLWVRWTHWINFPTLTIMIWSGLMIYWANAVYWPQIPRKILEDLGLSYRLAEGMAYHFMFMWLFALNGFLYVSYIAISGSWREIIPSGHFLKEAWNVVLHDLGISKKPLPPSKYNGAQKIAYTVINVMGLGSILTGLAIYKPIQLSWLKSLLGGYETARAIHYWLTLGYLVFFVVHVGQVIKAGWNKFNTMVSGSQSRAVTSVAVLLIGLGSAFGAFTWMRHMDESKGLPLPFRRTLEFNEKVWTWFLDPMKTDGNHAAPKRGRRARFNGDIGLKSPIDLKSWKMTVTSKVEERAIPDISITMPDIMKLPRTDIVIEFKCIEGWSEVMAASGVKFTDFLAHYHLGTHSGKPADFSLRRQDLYSDVGFETPDGDYYVSIDMKSMLSPQTLLAYEINGIPLSLENGAPLRLIIPNKYGVKNIKRIGRITFADSPQPDYWGEEGYDWFIGL